MQKGFTLMEVLVATAICGIALGVALAGLSQGHRATQRAILMEQAGQALKLALMEIASQEKQGLLDDQTEIEGEIEGMDGWTYKVSFTDLTIKLKEASNGTDEEGEEVETGSIPIEDLKETTIKLFDPFGHTFSIISWR